MSDCRKQWSEIYDKPNSFQDIQPRCADPQCVQWSEMSCHKGSWGTCLFAK